MPFCPQCRGEYRPGFTWCVDCNVALVDELAEPAASDQGGPPPVIVFETYSQTEAEVVRAKLEYFGVSAFLGGDLVLRSLYNPMNAAGTFGRIRVLVPADQAQQAQEILEERDEPHSTSCMGCDTEGGDGDPTPAAGSGDH